MASWSPEQLGAAAEFMQANINNPGAIQARAQELGLSNSDLLQAAQTVNPNLGLGDVNAYFGGAAPAQSRAAPTMAAYQQSPYLQQMADSVTQQSMRALNEQALPGVRSNSIASGGFGGSRQGIAEGLAIGRSQDALQGNLANLYNNDFQQDRNRALQQYGMEMQNSLGMGQLDAQNRGIDNQYSLGLLNAGNQRYGIDQTYNLGMTNAANSRYGTDKGYEVGMANANASMQNAAASQANAAGNLALGQQQLGLNGLFGLLDRQYSYGQGALNSANTMQNTPMSYWQQFGQGFNALGQNGSSSMSTGASNPWAAALGGAQLANDWYKQAGTGSSGQFNPGTVGNGLIANQADYNSQIGF